MEAKQLSEAVGRLKFDLDEMKKRVNGSEKGTVRSNSVRSLMSIGTNITFWGLIVGRSDSVKGKPEILANAFAQDENGDESDNSEGYIETVVRTEKRKVCPIQKSTDVRFVVMENEREALQYKYSTSISPMKPFKRHHQQNQ